ncbi:hypothetical protein IMCC3317_42100 [Kordia antarctica]|uniref:HPt domain-containing protein n=1 Tax=Kordia antarctica TaxID=1218801 RepID=A0A7L4ZQM9_9FLAO|nr:Hpt domain-containing protein [Kordia antarctica]QHI38810.1 hypothetical protein IMCC3317_42100 [Kordia antarctica]
MGYNLEKIEAISDGDTEFIEAVVVAFIEEIPEDLARFEREVALENYEAIYQVSHKIKPNLDLLGMQEPYALNLQILEWTKAESNMADIATTFKVVNAEIKSNIAELKKEFNLD